MSVVEIVEFFFVDTTPFVDKYFTDPGEDTYDWKGILPRQVYLSKLLQVIRKFFSILIYYTFYIVENHNYQLNYT